MLFDIITCTVSIDANTIDMFSSSILSSEVLFLSKMYFLVILNNSSISLSASVFISLSC